MPRKKDCCDSTSFMVGQRVRVIAGPLRDLHGHVQSCGDQEPVLVDAGEQIPGLSIRISKALLEAIDR